LSLDKGINVIMDVIRNNFEISNIPFSITLFLKHFDYCRTSMSCCAITSHPYNRLIAVTH
jgi:hypothetical protein